MPIDQKKLDSLIEVVRNKIFEGTENYDEIISVLPEYNNELAAANPIADLNRKITIRHIEMQKKIYDRVFNSFYKELSRIAQIKLNDTEIEELINHFSTLDLKKLNQMPESLWPEPPEIVKKWYVMGKVAMRNITHIAIQIEQEERNTFQSDINQIKEQAGVKHKDDFLYG
ncbi:MAG: hypothetical protein NTU58_01505 [Candidatus Nealsonbacteria bacterium]|nr:hypothetical protein [Candidatus Nealsonbacteria bacterium]